MCFLSGRQNGADGLLARKEFHQHQLKQLQKSSFGENHLQLPGGLSCLHTKLLQFPILCFVISGLARWRVKTAYSALCLYYVTRVQLFFHLFPRDSSLCYALITERKIYLFFHPLRLPRLEFASCEFLSSLKGYLHRGKYLNNCRMKFTHLAQQDTLSNGQRLLILDQPDTNARPLTCDFSGSDLNFLNLSVLMCKVGMIVSVLTTLQHCCVDSMEKAELLILFILVSLALGLFPGMW